jgi:cob(I)alamin adenosyltransferase
MSVYTRTGDSGETDLFGNGRVPKDAVRLEVCGPLDELNCWLGLARCEPLSAEITALLEHIQRRLFDIGAELMAVDPSRLSFAAIALPDVQWLEQTIDRFEADLASLNTFILPTGSRGAAVLHLARAVCRRAERRLVALARAEPKAVSAPLLAYFNRLSDLLFVLARTVNGHADISDTFC